MYTTHPRPTRLRCIRFLRFEFNRILVLCIWSHFPLFLRKMIQSTSYTSIQWYSRRCIHQYNDNVVVVYINTMIMSTSYTSIRCRSLTFSILIYTTFLNSMWTKKQIRLLINSLSLLTISTLIVITKKLLYVDFISAWSNHGSAICLLSILNQ